MVLYLDIFMEFPQDYRDDRGVVILELNNISGSLKIVGYGEMVLEVYIYLQLLKVVSV